jgi:hypothetical protein
MGACLLAMAMLVDGCTPPATENATPPGIDYSLGFLPQEHGQDGSTWRWMGQDARILLRNTNRDMRLELVGRIPSELAHPPTVTLELNGTRLDQLVDVRGEVRRQYDVPASMLGTGDSSTLLLTSSRTFTPRELDPRSPDERRLSFAVYAVSWEPK